MSLPRYPAYKASGVEWLGEVPDHWHVDRLKASIVSCKNGIWGDEPTGEGADIACVRVADFDRPRLVVNADIPTMRLISERERDGRILSNGNLLLEKSGGGEKQPVGQVVLYDLDVPAVCSNFVARISLAEGMWPRYWMYVHAAAYSNGVNKPSIKQTSGIQNLDQSQYFDERGPFPDVEEQRAIAGFLDSETGMVDVLIAKQERLLALLVEKRQATISHAVTRGLNPDAPMKESDIPWLGKVPAHWQLPPLYLRYSIELGKMLDTTKITGAHLTPYLRNVDVQWDCVSADDLPEMDISPEERDRFTVRNGDLLVCEGGEVGRSAVVCGLTKVLGYQKALHRLRSISLDECPRYLFYVFRWAAYIGVFSGEGQSTIAHLTGEKLRKYRFPKPTIEEQQAIATFLDEELRRLDSLCAEAERTVSLLKERRTVLISSAVTGKIDVDNLSRMKQGIKA